MYKRSYWPTTEWRTCCPEDIGMDRELLAQADNVLKQYKRVNGFLVVRHGMIAYERYYNGYDANDLNRVNSVTKSVLSALIGIAIDKGYIKSLNQKLYKFFPEYLTKNSNFFAREVTLKQLLLMTSGMCWKSSKNGKQPMFDRIAMSRNWVEFILSIPFAAEEAGCFKYNNAGSHLLAAVLAKSAGMSPADFADKHLFGPIGIQAVDDKAVLKEAGHDFGAARGQWLKDPQGINTGGGELSLRLREMAKLGFLYLNNGMWDGSQIISEEWIRESTDGKVQGIDGYEYGYHWWVKQGAFKEYFAWGYGGQYMIMVPAFDLAVIFTCKPYSGNSIRNDPKTLLYEYIVPAIKET